MEAFCSSKVTRAVPGSVEFVSLFHIICRPSLKFYRSWETSSITWEDLGNKLHAGCVSLKEFRAYLSQGPASLNDIPVIKLHIVGHLGQNILVPIMFCSSWKVRP